MSADIEEFRDLESDFNEPLPLPDQTEHQRATTPHRLRRWIGGALVATTVVTGGVQAIEHPEATAISAAHYAADAIYQDTPLGWAAQAFDAYEDHEAGWDHPIYTEFKTYPSDEETPRHPLVTNFIFTGLREMHGEQIASEIDAATDHQYPIRYQENGNQPITADSMAEQLIQSIKEYPLDTPYIGFTCHSMGGIVLIETLDRLQQMGYKLPKIAFIDFLSTPSGMQTARFGAAGNFLTRAQIGQSATGTVISSVFSQMQAQSFRPKWYMHDITNAFAELSSGASPELTDSQMQALDQVDSLPALIAKLRPLKGVISKDTVFRYYGPTDPDTDGVVNDTAAHQQLADAVREVFGANMPYIAWGAGHAATDFNSSPEASNKLKQGEQPSAAMIGSSIRGGNPSNLTSVSVSRS